MSTGVRRLSAPTLDAYLTDLPRELTDGLLRVALASVKRPPLLVVGGKIQLTRDASSELILERLVALGEHHTVITADVNGAP